jgi:hypothetical protein
MENFKKEEIEKLPYRKQLEMKWYHYIKWFYFKVILFTVSIVGINYTNKITSFPIGNNGHYGYLQCSVCISLEEKND